MTRSRKSTIPVLADSKIVRCSSFTAASSSVRSATRCSRVSACRRRSSLSRRTCSSASLRLVISEPILRISFIFPCSSSTALLVQSIQTRLPLRHLFSLILRSNFSGLVLISSINGRKLRPLLSFSGTRVPISGRPMISSAG